MTLLPHHPGIKLAEILAVSNIGLNKFSVYMGCREQEIVELLNGSVSLTSYGTPIIACSRWKLVEVDVNSKSSLNYSWHNED